MVQILLATNNIGKVREIQALIEELAPAYREQISLILPLDIGLHLDVVEDGNTYAENAARKAIAFCRSSNLLTLADDSGLEVTALGGEPGLHSHRYAPMPNATDADRRAFLLRNLRQHTRPWRARFVCTIPLLCQSGAASTRAWNTPPANAPGKSSRRSAAVTGLATTRSSCSRNWARLWPNCLPKRKTVIPTGRAPCSALCRYWLI